MWREFHWHDWVFAISGEAAELIVDFYMFHIKKSDLDREKPLKALALKLKSVKIMNLKINLSEVVPMDPVLVC